MTFNHLKNKNINFTYHSSHSVCDIYHNIINICLLLIKFWTHFNIFTTIIISIFLSSPITIHFIIFHHNNSGCMNTLQHAIYMHNYTLYSFTIKKCGPRRSHLDTRPSVCIRKKIKNLRPQRLLRMKIFSHQNFFTT